MLEKTQKHEPCILPGCGGYGEYYVRHFNGVRCETLCRVGGVVRTFKRIGSFSAYLDFVDGRLYQGNIVLFQCSAGRRSIKLLVNADTWDFCDDFHEHGYVPYSIGGLPSVTVSRRQFFRLLKSLIIPVR